MRHHEDDQEATAEMDVTPKFPSVTPEAVDNLPPTEPTCADAVDSDASSWKTENYRGGSPDPTSSSESVPALTQSTGRERCPPLLTRQVKPKPDRGVLTQDRVPDTEKFDSDIHRIAADHAAPE